MICHQNTFMYSVNVIINNIWHLTSTKSDDSSTFHVPMHNLLNLQWYSCSFTDRFCWKPLLGPPDLLGRSVWRCSPCCSPHSSSHHAKDLAKRSTQRVCALYTMFAQRCISVISKSKINSTGKNTSRNAVINGYSWRTVPFKSLRLVRIFIVYYFCLLIFIIYCFWIKFIMLNKDAFIWSTVKNDVDRLTVSSLTIYREKLE